MSKQPPADPAPKVCGDCLARSVVQTLAEEPQLEAVTIDREHRKLAVATLGQANVPRIVERLTGRYDEALASEPAPGCSLLEGQGDCAACGKPLSPETRRQLNITRSGGRTTIARVTCPTAPSFWRWRDIALPKVVARDVEFIEDEGHENEWKPQLALAVACGILGLLAAYAAPEAWRAPVFALSYLAGAWFPAVEVWERLRRRAIDVHFLMLAVAAGSAAIGAWGEGAILLFLFSLSGALEHYALGRTRREIRSLFRDAPKAATVLDEDGREHETPVDQLRPGQRLLVKPGAQFPADAELLNGATAADESNLTGEAAPVEKRRGDTVLSGTLNLWGAVECLVLRPAAESALRKIIKLIKEAQHHKAPAQRFTERFSAPYTWFALGLSLVMFFVWWLGLGLPAFHSSDEATSAFYRTMTLLVVSAPCALVLSIPSAVLAAIARGARHGVLFRGGAAVEKLAEVNVVCLDKTGTLTTGELKVESVESFPPGREAEVAQMAVSLERLSNHPLARAVTRYGKQQGVAPVELEHFESLTGQGLRARRNGVEFRLGRREWVAEAAELRHDPPPAADPGLSEIWVAGGELAGRVRLRDDVRSQAREVVDELRAEGLRALVLTGDRPAAAFHLREELRLDDVRAELKPEDKVAAIRELTDQGRRVAMVGDGVNDAPSLAAAHVGVAMGARGSDAALEQADVVLMHDRLENFLAAYRLSVRARRVIRQNLAVSLGTVAVLMGFALLGKIPLTLGVIGHEGSTVIVVMNSLRLLIGRAGGRAAAGRPPQPGNDGS